MHVRAVLPVKREGLRNKTQWGETSQSKTQIPISRGRQIRIVSAGGVEEILSNQRRAAVRMAASKKEHARGHISRAAIELKREGPPFPVDPLAPAVDKTCFLAFRQRGLGLEFSGPPCVVGVQKSEPLRLCALCPVIPRRGDTPVLLPNALNRWPECRDQRRSPVSRAVIDDQDLPGSECLSEGTLDGLSDKGRRVECRYDD